MKSVARLCVLAAILAVTCRFAAAAQETPKANLDIKATIIRIADHWVDTWIDSQWDEAKGIYMWRHGPYSDAFEHHYVAAVLINTPGSKYHGSETLSRRVTSDLVYHSRIFIEQFRDKGLRGYWALNGASDKGVPVGSGSWQSRSYLRACTLLDSRMKPEEQRAWREGAKWLVAALTADWTENYGPWWSTNKISDHVAFVALWLHLTKDPQARQFLDRQFDWYWAAFAPQGMADKYHNYFAKTLYRLAAILFAPEASRFHAPLLERARMFRSFVTDNGLFDAALHDEPNSEQSWHAKLGPVLALLLLASPQEG